MSSFSLCGGICNGNGKPAHLLCIYSCWLSSEDEDEKKCHFLDKPLVYAYYVEIYGERKEILSSLFKA